MMFGMRAVLSEKNTKKDQKFFETAKMKKHIIVLATRNVW